MALVTLAAVPMGTYTLLTLNSEIMQRVIGILVLGLLLSLFRGVRSIDSREIAMSAAAGIFSGAVTGATGLSRLLVAIYFLSSTTLPRPSAPISSSLARP